MSPTVPLHVAPDAHDNAIRECLEAHRRGNPQHARTLALTAGMNAALLGIKSNECPLNKEGLIELHQEWLYGFKLASTTNDNDKQGRLL